MEYTHLQPDGIKFDWISFTLPRIHDETTLPGLVLELFGLDFQGFREVRKKRNYYRRSFLLGGPNGDKLIEVFVDPDVDDNRETNLDNRNTTLVQVSGFALSAYAGNPLQIDVPDLFRRVLAAGGKPTVLHIAMDDMTSRLPWDEIAELSSPDRYRDHIVSTSRRQPININKETIYYGQRRDRNSVCIYRKDRLEETKFAWVRVEYRTTDRPTAKAIAERIAAGDGLGPLVSGLVRRFLDFRQKSLLTKYNRPQCKWWGDFLGNVDKMIICRDLAPRRKPPKPKPKTKPVDQIISDIEYSLDNDYNGENYAKLMECIKRRGFAEIEKFGKAEQPEVLQEIVPEIAQEMVGSLPEIMTSLPPGIQDFALDISF